MLQGYIGVLIDEMRGQGMSVPLAPLILGKDPPIRRHETEYMPVPLGPTSRLGFDLVLDWARGLALGQASFQALGWVPSFLVG